MNTETWALLISAVIIGVTHTLLGPDHYLPFVALARARQWSIKKTTAITLLCGAGHILGSILIGLIGILGGWTVGNLEAIEAIRGEVAAWLFIILGIIYLLWAIRNLRVNQKHEHLHAHDDGVLHQHEHEYEHGHEHIHVGSHIHPHPEKEMGGSLTYWSLFIVFIFGPCEALIPLLMFPAIIHHGMLAVAVVTLFALTTLVTMLILVLGMSFGLNFGFPKKFTRYSHVLAGLVLITCGTAIHLGL